MILKNGKRLDGMGDSMPIGSIVEYNGTDIPDGWEILPGDANVYIGTTEPADGQEVWIKKSNNLWTGGSSFAVNVTNTINLYLKAGTYTLSVGSVTTNSPSATAHVGFTNANGEKFLIKFLEKNTNKKITFTLEQDAVQITMWSGDYWAASSGYQTTYNNLMLVKGDKALPYEPYIAKEIYVKNDNGVYEEFYNETNLENYSTREQRIGTWIDGKPLYRKVVEFAMPKVANDGTYPTNIITNIGNNMEHLILKTAWITSNIQKQTLPYINNSGYMAKAFAQIENNGDGLIISTTNGIAFSEASCLGIVEYTKTTD